MRLKKGIVIPFLLINIGMAVVMIWLSRLGQSSHLSIQIYLMLTAVVNGIFLVLSLSNHLQHEEANDESVHDVL